MTLAAPVEARVTADLAAYRHGPAALDARLNNLTRVEILTRYRALLERVELTAALRPRRAAESVARGTAAAERAALLRGGNR